MNTIRKCLYCESDITLSNPKNRYCSSSCAASFNNKKRSNESKHKQAKSLKETLEKKFTKYPSTKVNYSPITGKPYNLDLHRQSWHNPYRMPSALRLAKMFNFELGQHDSENKIIQAIDNIKHLYEVEQLSTSELANMFNIEYSDFGMWLKKALQLQLRSRQSSLKLSASKRERNFDSDYSMYRHLSKFTFGISEYARLPGLDLAKFNGWYHPLNNPNGAVRDHKLSVKYGFEHNIPPYILRHPANCEILSHKTNCAKGSKCSISLESLCIAIDSW